MSRYYKRAQNIGWFVIEVDTTIAGTTGVGNFELRVSGVIPSNCNIVWGDGTMDRNVTATITHNYPAAGIYKVAVVGVLPRVFYGNAGDKDKVKKILSFGDIVWGSFLQAFWGCGINQINGVIGNGQLVTSFAIAFTNNQINTIPQGFFDNCPNVTVFSTCFQGNGLIPNCPSDLFANNPLANNFTNCFAASSLPTATYSDMLVSLDQNNQNLNVPFHAGGSTYTGAAAIAARANLVNVKGWNIIDGGQV